MKKIIATVAMLTLTFGAFAQINFGVKAGMNLSNISDEYSDISSMKLGANVGVYATYPVLPTLDVQAEVMFSMQGLHYDGTSAITAGGTTYANANLKGNYEFNYINVPVLAKFNITNNLSVFAGPQFGFAISAKNIGTITNTVLGLTSTIDINNDYNKDDDTKATYNAFDLSLAVGASYKFYGNLGVDLRYNIGMTNVFTDNVAGDNAKPYGKNGVLQLGLFYAF